MAHSTTGPLHAFLAGTGRDGRGRLASDVLALSDERLEEVHDYIQWLFPLPTRSAAQPGAPVLTQPEIDAIRTDEAAQRTLARATDRMLQFYRDTPWWLTGYDHNHLRITRIIHSLRILTEPDEARCFHEAILALNKAAGSPVNARSRAFWSDAAGA
ncbi:opioid growth factor receptor-related protein [Microvirga lotononidis]|uniref:Opioid growth factor receptor (OGFr) conserved region n=1 Tax=Microvirga lotononidis TaxID=864069 RepID=I4YL31_9HYPH|nr:opioid growth factor receptor-related protein [Microvirga lotononidis]EIM24673.1 Opioid growth factor receptor (OGFr) conserved region [Microvirga lotononidis]WQO26685.1 opioid growth factor receptor-related protein [Microvirga lotononidis]